MGQAFSFNGTTQAVIIPYSRSLVATNYSVEAWIKPLSQVSDPIGQDLIIGQAYGWELVARTGSSGIRIAFLFGTSVGPSTPSRAPRSCPSGSSVIWSALGTARPCGCILMECSMHRRCPEQRRWTWVTRFTLAASVLSPAPRISASISTASLMKRAITVGR